MTEKQKDVLQALLAKRMWRESEAKQCLSIWRRTGMNLQHFCREYGLSYKRVSRWRQKLQKKTISHEFVQVEPPGDRVMQRLYRDPIEIVLTNGRSVRVLPGFDNDSLCRVLSIAELGSCG
jgi:hypothetical protein